MILTKGGRFDRAKLRENEFESVILGHWNSIHANSKLFPWKPLVTSPLGATKPDAILINNDLKSWSVVEFELAHHSNSHFDNQFAALESADWSKSPREAIFQHYEETEARQINELIEFEPPQFICISDYFSSGLEEACRSYSFQNLVAVPFHDVSAAEFAVKIEKMPPILRAIYSENIRTFKLQSELKYVAGKIAYNLPSNFPNFSQITLNFAGALSNLRVHQLKFGRRIYLDPEVTNEKMSIQIIEVDPANRLFSIEN